MSREPIVFRPRVVTDAEALRMLEEKRARLAYMPQNGFHKDHIQPRVDETMPALLRKQAR